MGNQCNKEYLIMDMINLIITKMGWIWKHMINMSQASIDKSGIKSQS